MESAYFCTPIGTAYIEAVDGAITALRFLDTPLDNQEELPAQLCKPVALILDFLKGKTTHLDLLLDLQGTDFQKRVWLELMQIPYGSTMTYAQLSQKMGIPKSIRAVASAIGKNQLLVLIPCHRVVGSNQQLTGYAAGKWRKKWLLSLENPSQQTFNYNLYQ